MAVNRNYINNKKLFECIQDYTARRKLAESEGKPRPPMPDYAGECVLLICNRMGTRWNFKGYSFRSDMVGDAITDCVNAFYNFDSDRFTNPFGYFTQVAWRAMVRRISDEKKETYLKYKSLQNSFIAGGNWDSPEDFVDSGASKVGGGDAVDWRQVMDGIVQDFEDGVERKKQAAVERRAALPAKDEPTSNTVLNFLEQEPSP